MYVVLDGCAHDLEEEALPSPTAFNLSVRLVGLESWSDFHHSGEVSTTTISRVFEQSVCG
jgi:hypothetical protein